MNPKIYDPKKSAQKGVTGSIESTAVILIFCITNYISKKFDTAVTPEVTVALSTLVSSSVYGVYKFLVNRFKHK